MRWVKPIALWLVLVTVINIVGRIARDLVEYMGWSFDHIYSIGVAVGIATTLATLSLVRKESPQWS